MKNIALELRNKVTQYYSIENDSEEVKKQKKDFVRKILDKQLPTITSKKYKDKIKKISAELNLEVLDSTVTFHPSFKLSIVISRKKIEHFIIVKEFCIWISNIENIYTVYEINSLGEKFNIRKKSKYILYDPIIFSDGTDDTVSDLEKIKKSIESNWTGYSFVNIKTLRGTIDIEWITYTTEKNNLFHAYFGSFSPNAYKIV